MDRIDWGLNGDKVPKDIVNSLNNLQIEGPIPSLPGILKNSRFFNCLIKKNCNFQATPNRRGNIFTVTLNFKGKNENFTVYAYRIKGWTNDIFNERDLSYKNKNVSGNSFCVTGSPNVEYIGTDEFINQVFIGASFYLNKNIDNIVNIESAIYNRDLKYIVTKYYSYDLKNLKYNPNGIIETFIGRRGEEFQKANVSLTKGILQQMFNITKIFRDTYELTHGNLITDRVMVDETKYNKRVKVGNITLSIDCPITVKVSDFSMSSYILPNTIKRFFNKGSLSNFYIRSISFNPNVKEISGEYVYKVNNFFISQVLIDYQHRGISYYKSFDMYVFIMSLFMQDEFYTSLVANSSLNEFFHSLFFYDQDYTKIMKRLPKYIDRMSLDNVVGLLKGTTLYCNIWSDNILSILEKIK